MVRTAIINHASAAPTRGDQASRLRAMVRSGNPDHGASESRRASRCPIIAISSGKGGVGKTTIAVNLSIALSRIGKRVGLLDADLGTANADLLCGLNPTRRIDSIIGSRSIARSVMNLAMDAPGGFRLIPGSVGGQRLDSFLTESDRDELLRCLACEDSGHDALFIDTGAGVSDGVLGFVSNADIAIVVATPEPTSIADAYALIKSVTPALSTRVARTRVMLLVNQASGSREATSVHQRIDAVSRRFLGRGIDLLGHIERDEAVAAAVRHRTPLLIGAPRASAARDLLRIANCLSNCLWTATPIPSRERSLMRRLFA